MKELLQQYDHLELSTQLLIREAIDRGVKVRVLDHKTNTIELSCNGKREYVMQATRTGADSYVAPLLMGNKAVTKKILSEAGIRVPAGESLTDLPEDPRRTERFAKGDWVVKPNSTNFGIGITRLESGSPPETICEAFRAAFAEDSMVLAEEYIPGKEYRFLVIAGEVRAILHREPAHVTGDGKMSIESLVHEKNRDPRRGAGYRKPLEQLQLGKAEAAVLAESGYSFSSIPGAGTVVYLRKNSNISTGGDGFDCTDDVHPDYKQIAVQAAAALGAVICGADLIIQDIHSASAPDNYAVIELNYNPALHIHDYPTEGMNRAVERFVLDAIGFSRE
ncbi:MAG: hypothetical protein ACOC0D_01300 [Spirochaeta sp.]